jgi:hypothetical protein
MPPSGYNKIQVEALADFLRSCSQALSEEAFENSETYSEAIERECLSIRGELSRKSSTDFQARVLQLTLAFYTQLASTRIETSSDYQIEVEKALKNFSLEIEGIHIVGDTVAIKVA